MDSYKTQKTEMTPFTVSHIPGYIKHNLLEQVFFLSFKVPDY